MACGDLRAAIIQGPDVLSLQRGSIPAPLEAMATCLDASQGGSTAQWHGLPSLDLQPLSSQPLGLPQGTPLPQTLLPPQQVEQAGRKPTAGLFKMGRPNGVLSLQGAQGPTSQASAIIIIPPAFPWTVDRLNICTKFWGYRSSIM